ncbi:hypothetical protein MNBD_CHLOROFLEXI01-2268, partial [hydrothermal vent metagenome]
PNRYIDPSGHDLVTLNADPDELDIWAQAIDIITTTIEDDQISVLEFLTEQALLIGGGAVASGVTTAVISELLVSAGVIAAGAVSAVIMGIIVSIVVGIVFASSAWNKAAIDNAVTSLKTFRDHLVGNEKKGIAGILDRYVEGDTIYITISSTFLAPDKLYIGLYNDENGFYESKGYFKEETEIINKAGSMLIDMFVAYGSQIRSRSNPIRYSTSWFSSQEVFNNDKFWE